ncbi:hypothetical protein FOXB_05244 [Fusarium oxysporum f. sp. conglutinans Fo5176]|uniref:Uncharacterized protein n=1 Tax=Fusarium oxysporum (strain Fo5176) TaxID=660025 RepID=F9FFR5_FUSOF|nr:hypothetical protein FOXB_05244 [Fusarium oxysporum f. sp. conglutinans Fo5176]
MIRCHDTPQTYLQLTLKAFFPTEMMS